MLCEWNYNRNQISTWGLQLTITTSGKDPLKKLHLHTFNSKKHYEIKVKVSGINLKAYQPMKQYWLRKTRNCNCQTRNDWQNIPNFNWWHVKVHVWGVNGNSHMDLIEIQLQFTLLYSTSHKFLAINFPKKK